MLEIREDGVYVVQNQDLLFLKADTVVMAVGTKAENKLAELLVTQDYLNGAQTGDFRPEWPKYRWEVEVVEWGQASLKEITVNVLWEDAQQERMITLNTLVYPQE